MDVRLNIYLCWIHLCCYGGIQALGITQGPRNQTVLIGNTASFSCQVTGDGASGYVFWKKISAVGEFAEILSYNMQSMNATKYITDGGMTLHVQHVALHDEGLYECQAGADRKVALLSVAVTMSEMRLEATRHRSPDSEVQFTCHVIHCRPPATVRWFLGTDEITDISSTVQQIPDDNGFGDTVSDVTVIYEGRDSLRCTAHLPGTSFTKSEVLAPPTLHHVSAASTRPALTIPSLLLYLGLKLL